MHKTLSALGILFAIFQSPQVNAADLIIAEKWSKLLKQIVEVNSGTENTEGLEEVRRILIPEFEHLGFKTTVYDSSNGHKVLSFDFPHAKAPKLLLIGHIDTVFTKTSSFQKESENGDHWVGPGVMDMKGGVVMILNLLSELSAHGEDGVLQQLKIILDDDEEIGSPNSQTQLREFAAHIPYALVYEPGLPDGSVITSEYGVHWIELSVIGKAAHAGADFENGLNACVAIGAKLADIAKLTNLKHHLTVNIGTVQGGTKPNIVCGNASAKIDIRYLDPKELGLVLQKIEKIVARQDAYNPNLNAAPRAEVKEIIHVPVVAPASSRQIFEILKAVATSLKQRIGGKQTAFVSDGNQIAPTGIQVLVGLGPCGENPHTDQEFMILHTYPERLKLNLALIHRLVSN